MSNVVLATPVSHLFEDNNVAQKIIEYSDCLEARERTIHLHFPRRHLFHVDVDLTHSWDSEKKRYLLECIEQLPDLRLVTFQATVNCDRPVLKDGQYYLGGVSLTSDEMMKNAKSNVSWLRSFLPVDVEVGLENNNYYPTEAYKYVTDADFLSELVTETNIRFLLDIAHAFVTAHNRNMKLERYLSELPLNRCAQVHLCQPVIKENGLAIDAHEVPEGELRDLTRDIISELGVKYLTVEYYKDSSKLISTLEQERKYFL